jgi:hypothetical protein
MITRVICDLPPLLSLSRISPVLLVSPC